MISRSFLKKVLIFSECSDRELRAVAGELSEQTLGQDEVLFHEGDEGSEFFIVKKGTVKIVIQTADGNEKEVARFGSGNFFGEMSIVDDAPRSATCQAVEESVLYHMHERDFYRLMERQPHAAIKIMYKMLNTTAQRLKATSRFVADMVRWGNDASRRAITDEITGAYNRRYLDRLLTETAAAASAADGTFSMIMMDLDRFREINEAHGHEVGNTLLCRAVEVMKTVLDETDVLARYGGDEFTILLRDTKLEEAARRAEKIRLAVEEALFEIAPLATPLAVTVSQGVAGYPDSGTGLDEITKRADRALYQAKEEGRNRVVSAGTDFPLTR
jgi:diguanylate cyclase (GGDEF)-like protein